MHSMWSLASNSLLLSALLTAEPLLSQDRTSHVQTGDYFDQQPPGIQVRLFAPRIISTSDYEHGSPAFSPDGKAVYWSVRLRDIVGREVIRFANRENGQWTSPRTASFSDTTQGDLYPTFSHIFGSNRNGNFDIYWTAASIIDELKFPLRRR